MGAALLLPDNAPDFPLRTDMSRSHCVGTRGHRQGSYRLQAVSKRAKVHDYVCHPFGRDAMSKPSDMLTTLQAETGKGEP